MDYRKEYEFWLKDDYFDEKDYDGWMIESNINTASVNAFVDWIFNFHDKKELYWIYNSRREVYH